MPKALHTKDPRKIRIGFVALTDAAPLLVASDLGLFARHGLEVELSREIGWATMRDKVLFGELDAAHALGGMLFSTALGIDSPSGDVMTACVLSLNGNAITLSRALWDTGARTPATLREAIHRLRSTRLLNFGVVHRGSFHHVQLRDWLRSGDIDVERDVRIVVVPPAQMYRNLAAGTIDGCCVGEPWNSVAVAQGAGCIVSWSNAQFPEHIEKVLMVRTRFAESRAAEHSALVQAVIEACAWCDVPANRAALAGHLSQPRHLNLPAKFIQPALGGPFALAPGHEIPADGIIVFHRNDANAPQHDRAAQVLRRFVANGLIGETAQRDRGLIPRLFRNDLYESIVTSEKRHGALLV